MEDEALEYALQDAAREGDLDTVKFFIKRGATVDFDAINEAIAEGRLGVVKYLVGELEVYPSDALYTAMSYGRIPIADYLISIGYYPGSQEIIGAVSGGSLSLLKYLRKMGVKVDDRKEPILPWVLSTYPDMSPVMAGVLADILIVKDLPSNIPGGEAKEYLHYRLKGELTVPTGYTDIERLINLYC